MVYYLVIMLNVVMALISIGCLLKTSDRYNLSHRWEIYIFLTVASMLYLICTCIYNLTLPVREWRLSILSSLWCAKTLYFAYTVRFSSIKKDRHEK
jgi:ABC-type arginine transport system permease subunit